MDAGHATIVTAKAMGQAMMNCLGQLANHCMDGPVKMRPIMPDMVAAIMNVIMTWVRKILFLLNERSLSGTVRHQEHPAAPLTPIVERV